MPCRDIAPRRNARRPAPGGEPGRGDVSWWVERTSVERRRLADDVVGRRVPSGQGNVEAQGRGASAFHIFDGGTPKKVTERPPPRGGSDARVPDPVTPR